MEYVRTRELRPPLPAGPWLVVGLARSGVAAAVALRNHGESVFGVDSGRPGELGGLDEAGVGYELETSGVARLRSVRSVVKSPGVPSDAPVILEAERRGLAVLGELELGWRLVPHRTIAITGTNGKTTTTELTAHILRETGRPVEVAGNVGRPLSSLAPGGEAEPPPDDLTVVCECSSFQLEDTSRFAPEVAVLLNLSPDHLDRHGDLESYRRAKLRVFRNQGEGDVAVINAGDGLSRFEPDGAGAVVRFSVDPALPQPDGIDLTPDGQTVRLDGKPLIGTAGIGIGGRHNVGNAMAAAAAAAACGIPADAIAGGLGSFRAVPHRFEPVGCIEGVQFINDSKATNVEATLAALASFDGSVHLILGGRGKGEPFDRLVPAVRRACRGIYLIGETADEIGRALAPADVQIVRYCDDLETAVGEAAGAAVPGETVLLSPACASFDQFPDFECRGERFRELTGELRG